MTDIRRLREDISQLEYTLGVLGEIGFANHSLSVMVLNEELGKRASELRSIEEQTDLRTPAMLEEHADGNSCYSFPHSTRKEMLEFILAHDTYNVSYSDVGISWDIKVRDFIDAIHDGSYEFDSDFDARWEEYREEHSSQIFEEACEMALKRYTSGLYQPPGDGNRARFAVAGRNGGHLVLTAFQFNDEFMGEAVRPFRHMLTRDDEAQADWLRNDISNDHLAALYGLVRAVDVETAQRTDELRHHVSFIREAKEKEWTAEPGMRP